MSAKDNAAVPTGHFIQTLNEMIDNQGKRLAALRNRVPNIVLLSLFASQPSPADSQVTQVGSIRRRIRMPVYIMGLLISVVILLILDLDRPSSGFIQVSQQPMIDTAASIASFSD